MAMNSISINNQNVDNYEIKSGDSRRQNMVPGEGSNSVRQEPIASGRQEPVRQEQIASRGQEPVRQSQDSSRIQSGEMPQGRSSSVSYDPSSQAPVSLSGDRQGVERYNGRDGKIYEILEDPQAKALASVSGTAAGIAREGQQVNAVQSGNNQQSLSQQLMAKNDGTPSLTQDAIKGSIGPSLTQEIVKKAIDKKLIEPSVTEEFIARANKKAQTEYDPFAINPFDPKNGEVDVSDLTPNQLKDYLDQGKITQAKYDMEMQKRGLDEETTSGVKGSVNTPPDSRKNTALGNTDTKTTNMEMSERPESKNTSSGLPNSPTAGTNTVNINVDKANDSRTKSEDEAAARKEELQAETDRQNELMDRMMKTISGPPEPLNTVLPEYALPDQTGNFQGKVSME